MIKLNLENEDYELEVVCKRYRLDKYRAYIADLDDDPIMSDLVFDFDAQTEEKVAYLNSIIQAKSWDDWLGLCDKNEWNSNDYNSDWRRILYSENIKKLPYVYYIKETDMQSIKEYTINEQMSSGVCMYLSLYSYFYDLKITYEVVKDFLPYFFGQKTYVNLEHLELDYSDPRLQTLRSDFKNRIDQMYQSKRELSEDIKRSELYDVELDIEIHKIFTECSPLCPVISLTSPYCYS